MLRKMTLLIMSLVVFNAAFLSAQDSSDWYLEKPILEIRFTGLRTISRSEMEGVVAPYIGRPFRPELFRELQSRLYGLDYFEGLIIPEAIRGDEEGNTVILQFTVNEKPSLNRIEFSGNNSISANDLRNQITLTTDEMLNNASIRTAERAIRDYYLEQGYPDISVSSETSIDEDQRTAQVTFQIDEGTLTTVSQIVFIGNNFASESNLKSVMETKERSLFNRGAFREVNLLLDRQAIENYYWTRGYIDARVSDINRELVFDESDQRNNLVITINIEEGQQFVFGGYEFEGNTIFSNEDLLALTRQLPGRIINKQRIDLDYQRIVDRYYENGYIFNNFAMEEIRDELEVRFRIEITEASRAHIENILVVGNTKTQDRVILRELPLEVGDVFSKSKIMQGLQNLYNLQFFNGLDIDTPQGSTEGLMDLIITVEEGQTIELLFGVVFSGDPDYPISGMASYKDSNFLGGGQTVGLEGNLSPVSQTLSLSFNESWFMGRRWSVGTELSYGHYTRTNIAQDPSISGDSRYVFTETTSYLGETYEAGDIFPDQPTTADIDSFNLEQSFSTPSTMEYSSHEISLGFNTGYTFHTMAGRFGVGTGIRSSLQYISYDDQIYRPLLESERNNLNQWLFTNQWWTRLSWDTRDIIFSPQNGAFFSQNYTVTGGFLGGQTHYTRSDSRAEAYIRPLSIPLGDSFTFKTIFRAKSTLSLLMDPLGGNGELVTRSSDLLYVDGMTNGRGWNPERGGYSVWTQNLEMRIPLNESVLWWDTFLEGTLLNNVFGSNLFAQPLEDFRFSFGTGFRLSIPQFPIGFFFAAPFQIQEGGVTWYDYNYEPVDLPQMRLVISFIFDFF